MDRDFEDHPARADRRVELLPQHFDYLALNSHQIRLAGGIREDDDHPWVGGVWIISAKDRVTAARLCEDDPFYSGGLRAGYRLLQWGRAPCYGSEGSVKV